MGKYQCERCGAQFTDKTSAEKHGGGGKSFTLLQIRLAYEQHFNVSIVPGTWQYTTPYSELCVLLMKSMGCNEAVALMEELASGGDGRSGLRVTQ